MKTLIGTLTSMFFSILSVVFAFSPAPPVKISLEIHEEDLGYNSAINFNVNVEANEVTGLNVIGSKAQLKLFLPTMVKLVSGKPVTEIIVSEKKQTLEFTIQTLVKRKGAYQIGAVLDCDCMPELETPVSAVVLYLEENRGINLSEHLNRKSDKISWVKELLGAAKCGDTYSYSLNGIINADGDSRKRSLLNVIEDKEWYRYVGGKMSSYEIKENKRAINWQKTVEELRRITEDGSATDEQFQAALDNMDRELSIPSPEMPGKIKSMDNTALASDRTIWITGNARYIFVDIYSDTTYLSVGGAKAKLYIKRQGQGTWETNSNWVDYLGTGSPFGSYSFSFQSSIYTSSDSFKVVISCENWYEDVVIDYDYYTTYSLSGSSVAWLIADSDTWLIMQMNLIDFGGYPLESYEFASIQDEASKDRYLAESNNLHPDPVTIYYPVAIEGGVGAYYYGWDEIELDSYYFDVLRHEWGHHLYWSYGGEVNNGGDGSYTTQCSTSSSNWIAYREGWADCFKYWNILSFKESNSCQNGELYQPDNLAGFVDLADAANDGETAQFSLHELVTSMDGTSNWREYMDALKDNFPGDTDAINDVCDINGLPDGTGLLLASAPVSQPTVRTTDLYQSAPNPMNPSCTIKFSMGGNLEQYVKLYVYDVRGRIVRRLVDHLRSPGDYTVFWDGTNEQGAEVASGVYFYRLTAGDFTSTKKVVILK